MLVVVVKVGAMLGAFVGRARPGTGMMVSAGSVLMGALLLWMSWV